MGSFERFDERGNIVGTIDLSGRPCRDRTDDPLVKSYTNSIVRKKTTTYNNW
jgi:hypothetical protein